MARNDVHHLRISLAHYSLHWCSCRSCHGFRCIFIELWFVWFSPDSRLPFKKCHWRLFVIQQSTMCRKNECSLFIAAHTRVSRVFNAHLRWFDHRTSGVCSRGSLVPKLEAVRPLAHILSPLRDIISVVTWTTSQHNRYQSACVVARDLLRDRRLSTRCERVATSGLTLAECATIPLETQTSLPHLRPLVSANTRSRIFYFWKLNSAKELRRCFRVKRQPQKPLVIVEGIIKGFQLYF